MEELLQQKDYNYYYGVALKEGVMIKDGWITSITKVEDGIHQRIEYNIKTKEIRMSEKEIGQPDYSPVISVLFDIKSNTVLSNDRLYWEGSSLDDVPFGFGSLYNSSNQLLYRGVYIIDRKECFGADFYPDLGVVEYSGCYWDGQRHGMGMLYDRIGKLLYKGDYLCDSSDYEKCLTLNTYLDDYSIHSLIEELIIAEYCNWNLKNEMELCGYENLRRIQIGRYCLPFLRGFTISANPQLSIIEAKDDCFHSQYSDVKVVIKSMMIAD